MPFSHPDKSTDSKATMKFQRLNEAIDSIKGMGSTENQSEAAAKTAASQASRHTNKKRSKEERKQEKQRREFEEDDEEREMYAEDTEIQERQEEENLERFTRSLLDSLIVFMTSDNVAGFRAKIKKESPRLLKSKNGLMLFHAAVSHDAVEIFRFIARANTGIFN
jgi:superfamily I DNA and/or RNA helicase